MSQILKVKAKVDVDAIKGKVSQLLEDKQLKLSIHQLLYKMCDPYVPMQTGMLAQARVEITDEYVRYAQPYAHYQYEGILYLVENGSAWAKAGEEKYPSDRMLVHSKEMHPKATRHWDKVMLAEQGQVFLQQVQALILLRARQIYG